MTPVALALLLLAPLAPPPPGGDPKPVPATREEVKAALEAHKAARPRLPLPPAGTEGQGVFAKVNNARFRAYYLPDTPRDSGFTPDPAMTLDGTFKVKLFWVVSRVNNCYYCLGHQEHKLLAAGVSDDGIAALDGDWKGLPAKDEAALAFTRKLAFTPHLVTPDDVAALGKHYTPAEALEVVVTVANFCSTNRWTDGLNIPLEADGAFFKKGAVDLSKYTTPTSPKYSGVRSAVAPLAEGAAKASAPKAPARPPLETREQVEAKWKEARTRKPTLPLADAADAKRLAGAGPVSNWVRLAAAFPKAGAERVAETRVAAEKGKLSARLKATVAWAAAREDRAWYALAVARDRLNAAGLTDDQAFALDGDAKGLPERERLLVAFVRKLTLGSSLVADADVEALRKAFSDHEVAEIVYQTCNAAYFDRVTEAARLPLD